MRKTKFIIPIAILLLIHTFIFIGLAAWIIPTQVEGNASEDMSGYWTKYVGNQTIEYTGSGLKPVISEEGLEKIPDFNNLSFTYESSDGKYKGTGINTSEKSGPINVGDYTITYKWNDVNYNVRFTITPKSDINVAYIEETKEYFTTVEAALSAATSDGDNRSVWVIPDTNPTITTNCEVTSKVSLYLPYGDVTKTTISELKDGTPHTTCSDTDGDNVCNTCGEDMNKICTLVHSGWGPGDTAPSHTNSATFCKSNVKIADNVSLTNRGNIYIGAVINGGYVTRYSGLVASGDTDTGDGANDNTATIPGNYAQITLGINSVINNYGYIECNGYIEGAYEKINNEIVHLSKIESFSGSIREPFIVVENRQGQRFVNLGGGLTGIALNGMKPNFQCSPFNRFYTQNIATKLVIHYSSSLIAHGFLYANQDNNTIIFPVVSTSTQSIIQLTDSNYSYFIGETILNKDESIDNGSNKIYINVYGGANLNPLVLSLTVSVLGQVSISSEDIYLSIPWYFDVNLYPNTEKGQSSADFVFTQDVKIMTGASIKINEGANVTGSGIVIYDEYDEEKLGQGLFTSGYYSAETRHLNWYLTDVGAPSYYPVKDPGELIVNGTLSIDTLAGHVQTTNTGATLIIKSATTFSSKEIKSIGEKGADPETTLFSTCQYFSFSYTLQLKLYNSKVLTDIKTKNTYYSKEGYWDTNQSINTLTISYDTQGIGGSISTLILEKGTTTHILTRDNLPILNEYHYRFAGWYDQNGEYYYVGKEINVGNINLIARWEPIDYLINYKMVSDGVTIPQYTNTNSTTVNITSLINGNTLYDVQYNDPSTVFAGWSLTENGTYIEQLSLKDLEYLDSGVITLYGIWKAPENKTIVVTFIINNIDGTKTEIPISKETSIGSIQIDANNLYTENSSTGYSIDNNLDPTNDIYFDAWYSDDSFNYKISTPTTITLTEDTTIYAQVIQKHTIIFNPTISGFEENTHFAYGTYKLPSYDSLEYNLDCEDGTLSFEGWIVGDETKNDGDEITIDDDITIIASIKKTITITFDANGGNCTTESSTIEFDYTAGTGKLTSLPETTRDGYELNGWYSASSGGNKITTSTTFDSSTTIYAQWKLELYSITYTVNNGENNENNPDTYNVEEVVTFKDPIPDEGYEFNGWYTDSAYKTKITSTNGYAKNLTLYAKIEKESGWPCITRDTLITLANGSHKRVDELTGNELLLVWDHVTGSYTSAKIAYIVCHDDIDVEHKVTKLRFSDSSYIEIIGEHVFFDSTLNKYVAIDEFNVNNYIGHNFLKQGDNKLEIITLVSSETYSRATRSYEVVTDKHLINFTNGILSTSAYLDPLLNVFDLIDNYQYDLVQMQEDIETYGLYTYEDFEGLIAEEAFEMYNAKYLKVAVGKGYITWEDILLLIDIYYDVDVKPL